MRWQAHKGALARGCLVRLLRAARADEWEHHLILFCCNDRYNNAPRVPSLCGCNDRCNNAQEQFRRTKSYRELDIAMVLEQLFDQRGQRDLHNGADSS